MSNSMSKDELVILALQERIGQLVVNYETQNAILRAEITILVSEKQAKEQDVAIHPAGADQI